MPKLPSFQRDGHALYLTLWSPHSSETSYVLCGRKGCEEPRQIIVNSGVTTTPISIHQDHRAPETVPREKHRGLNGLNTYYHLHFINHTLQQYAYTYFYFMRDPRSERRYVSHLAVEWHNIRGSLQKLEIATGYDDVYHMVYHNGQ